MKSIVILSAAVLLAGCSSAFTAAESDGSDASDAVMVDAAALEASAAEAAGSEAASPEAASLEAASSDASFDAMPHLVEAGSPDADAALMDAGTAAEAQADVAVEAQVDGAVGDAGDAGDASDCVDDLSNIGAGDFHVAFDVMGASVGGTLLSQWPACSASTVHWEVGENTAGGVISMEVGSGANYTDLTGTISVSDGAWHHIVVARVSATLSITVDGQLDTSIGGAGWPLTTLPSLQIGRSPCYAAFTGQIRNVCITRQ